MPDLHAQVVVIGGGITGLCCAHRLHALDVDALLLEASDHIGGRIETVHEDGYEFEMGPNTLLNSSEALQTLIRELGMQADIIEASRAAQRRYVLFHDRLEAVPMNPVAALLSPLLGPAGACEAVGDLFHNRPPGTPNDESVAAFVRRRFGSCVLENLVSPFLSGVYAGDPERLEIRSVLKKLVVAEERMHGGSVIRGLLQARRASRQSGLPSRPMRSITFRGGLAALPARLAMALGPRVRTCSRVIAIDQDEYGCRVVTANGDSIACTRVVIASETFVAADLIEFLPNAETIATDLRAITSANVCVVGMAFDQSALTHSLDGFGYLAGPGTQGPFLGCLFRSTIFPHTAPVGTPLLVCFLGGVRHDTSRLSDDQVVDLARAEVSKRLGAAGQPKKVFFKRWLHAIPQSERGHTARAERITAWSRTSLVSIISSGVYGVPLPSCIATGREEADRLYALVASDLGNQEAPSCP